MAPGLPVAARLLLGAVAFAAASLLADAAVAETGTSRFCSNTAANVVFFIDVTTPYDEIDRKALVEGIGAVFESVEGGGRIAIRTIADTFAGSIGILDECVPFCKSGGFLDDFFSSTCTEGVVINEKKHLRERIVTVLSTWMGRSSELKYSEIIRTLAMPGSGEYRAGRENRIYVFSDMIENSAYLPGAKFFGTKNTAIVDKLAKDRLVPDLHDATITAFGVGRSGVPGDRQALPQDKMEKLIDFWETYFTVAGTKLPKLQQTLGAVN